MARIGPIEYIRQVRSEMKKITWATRAETTVSVIAVFVMVFLASIFMFFSDQIISWTIRTILGLE